VAQHYSPTSYYTLGWVCPRDQLRQPFPRRRSRLSAAALVPPPPPAPGTIFGPVLCLALQASQPGAAALESLQPWADAAQASQPGAAALDLA
jgi:hypothetical protein